MSAGRLSIIVPCLNPGPRLQAALASVWAQREPAVELIVIDGGSTDGSLAWLRAHRDRISVLMSEPDGGIYEAMNKGVAAATREWVLFLGADDRLLGETVLGEAMALAERAGAGVMVGEAVYDDGRVYRLRPKANPLARNFVHHQGAFYRRELFAEHGGFDRTLAIAADYEFNLRLWQAGVRFVPLALRIAACGSRGASDSGRWRVYREEIAVRHRYFPAPRCWPWDAASVVRFLRKQLLRRRPRFS
ncbi:glycosyltransferase family 2 protein [Opitutus sp. ER46]|uniref:glycosyltransferase family 2 protein n=1 Tax=Opitutus sp. ER46 TaxID=2161864 RepID=UPI000D2FA9B9|nr:glycosyltransferase family 2 protein [Opitutus sp. ER46]PTX95557.1 glycosyltransferase [Opitutus sp. ER46]